MSDSVSTITHTVVSTSVDVSETPTLLVFLESLLSGSNVCGLVRLKYSFSLYWFSLWWSMSVWRETYLQNEENQIQPLMIYCSVDNVRYCVLITFLFFYFLNVPGGWCNIFYLKFVVHVQNSVKTVTCPVGILNVVRWSELFSFLIDKTFTNPLQKCIIFCCLQT